MFRNRKENSNELKRGRGALSKSGAVISTARSLLPTKGEDSGSRLQADVSCLQTLWYWVLAVVTGLLFAHNDEDNQSSEGANGKEGAPAIVSVTSAGLSDRRVTNVRGLAIGGIGLEANARGDAFWKEGNSLAGFFCTDGNRGSSSLASALVRSRHNRKSRGGPNYNDLEGPWM